MVEKSSTALVSYDTLKSDLLHRQEHLAGILPPSLVATGTLTAERFVSLALYFLSEEKALYRCSRLSLIQGIYKAAKDGLELGIDCYLVPFKGEATYIRDYRGDVKLIERSGKVAKAFAEVVYEHDVCEIDYGHPTKPLTHKPALRQRGKALGAYGAIVLKTGAWHVHYMDEEDIKRVRQQAPGREQDTWIKHTAEMWRKTALKNTAKYCQLTPQVAEAMQEEDTTLERLWTPTREQAQRNVVELFDRSDGRPEALDMGQDSGSPQDMAPHDAHGELEETF